MIEKPATVEVGGWWITATAGDAPFRVERLVGDGDTLIAIHSDGHGDTSVWYLLSRATYLGNGENPAPSDKMVETLATALEEIEHGALVDWRREHYANSVRRTLTGDPWATPLYQRVVTTIYRILRARGEW